MARFKKLWKTLVVSAVLAGLLSQSVPVCAKSYTYEVVLYAGNIGSSLNTAIVSSVRAAGGGASQAVVKAEGNTAVKVTGLGYGDQIVFDPQGSGNVDLGENVNYIVRGIRKSGLDNSDVGNLAVTVTGSEEYVVAYAVRGDMVDCTVQYLDTEGNSLEPSQVYYGNDGELIIVPYRYIDGWQPQAYNISKTLHKGETNVITFIYTRITDAAAEDEEGETRVYYQEVDGGTIVVPGGTTVVEVPGEGGEAAPGGGGAAAPEGGAAAPGGGAAAPGGGDAEPAPDAVNTPVEIPDQQTPQELVNLDDEETPLSNTVLPDMEERSSSLNYLPFYIGAAVASIAALTVLFFFLWKKKKEKAAVKN